MMPSHAVDGTLSPYRGTSEAFYLKVLYPVSRNVGALQEKPTGAHLQVEEHQYCSNKVSLYAYAK